MTKKEARENLARCCRWIGGITAKEIAAVMAEVRELPEPARSARLVVDVAARTTGYAQETGIPGVTVYGSAVMLTFGGDSYFAHGGARRLYVSTAATGPDDLPAIIVRYASALAEYADKREKEQLRAVWKKDERDRDVADVRAAAKGLRAIAARLVKGDE